MKKNIIVKISILAVSIVVISAICINSVFASTSYKIDKNMDSIMDTVAEMQKTENTDGMSSNPYDYIKSNDNYKQIVSLGPEALNIICEKIGSSSENGLKEYILAIAASEISKTDLKRDTFNWTNGKEWRNEWFKLLRRIPDSVEILTTQNELSINERNKSLAKLGVAAIPYIMDKVEKGDTSICPSLDELTAGNPKADSKKENPSNYIEWVKSNKDKFDDIREIVEKLKN